MSEATRWAVLHGSIQKGFAVVGPFVEWGNAYMEQARLIDSQPWGGDLVEILELLAADDSCDGGDYVQLVGGLVAGYKLYGPYATVTLRCASVARTTLRITKIETERDEIRSNLLR